MNSTPLNSVTFNANPSALRRDREIFAEMTEADVTPKARRFYDRVQPTEASEGGWNLSLDGRPARTPGARPFVLPTLGMARLLASEWLAQGTVVDWRTMPASRLAAVAIDGGEDGRKRAISIIGDYAASDLICYFAGYPDALVAHQEEVWGPILAWAAKARGLRFIRFEGVMHQPQPEPTLIRLRAILIACDDFTLAALALGASLFGSAILSLAVADRRLDSDGVVAAARLDELFQERQWGRDGESDRRALALAQDARMLEAWFAALSGPLCPA